MPDQPALSLTENLLDVLVARKALSPEQAEKLHLSQINTGNSLEEVIRQSNLVSEEEMVQAKAQILNVSFVNLAEIAVSPVALGMVPQAVAERYTVLPFNYDKAKNELSLAMADPGNLETIEFIERKAKARVRPFIATEEKIRQIVTSSYAQSLATEVKAALGEALPERPSKGRMAVDITGLGQVIREAPVAKIVSTILEFAMKARASDIHIEAEEGRTRVRYRIDGILHEKLVLPKSVHEAVISRVKILSGMRIDEKRVPQDGRFSFSASGQAVDLRVSCLPTVHGEKIVMRLLKKTGGVPDLPELGLRGLALRRLQEAILRPHGIIIVCGPTGSGKTTTLYSVLSRINTPKVNIITLEDPVEYEIMGVNQVQVNPAAGLTFASGLRSFLRQDPNIIMVGEIRDKETTDLAIQASLTGHLVFSTLHTNDASSALPRLLDLGAEPFLLASSMTCILAQRVVRRVCPDCKKTSSPPPELTEEIKKILGKLYLVKGKLQLVKGEKCARCNGTGYLGRIGIFEVLPITEKIARLILEHSSAREIEKQAVEEGMITLKQDGYLKAVEGVTTIEEVLRVAEE